MTTRRLYKCWPHVRVVGTFPDGQSALNLAAARLRHIAGTKWSAKRYMNMNLLKQQKMSISNQDSQAE